MSYEQRVVTLRSASELAREPRCRWCDVHKPALSSMTVSSLCRTTSRSWHRMCSGIASSCSAVHKDRAAQGSTHSALGARWWPRCWRRCRSRSVAESVFPTSRARRLRITSNGWAAVAGAGLMFALAVQTQSVWMQVVGSALVGLLGISAISVMRRRDGLTVSMQVPTEVSVGIPFDFEVEVSNGGRRRTAPLRITCYFPASIPVIVPPPVVYVDPVLAGEKTTVSITRVAVRRGFVNQTVLMVDAIGSFGFFRSARPFDGVGGMSAAPLAGPPLDLPRVLGVQAEGFGP